MRSLYSGQDLTTKADVHDAPTRVIENSPAEDRKGWNAVLRSCCLNVASGAGRERKRISTKPPGFWITPSPAAMATN